MSRLTDRTDAHPPPEGRAANLMTSLELPGTSLRCQLIGLVAFVILVSGALLASILASLRGEAIRTGERLTESFAQVIAEQTDRTFQAIDQRLQIVAGRFEARNGQGGGNAQGEEVFLQAQMAELPFVRALIVTDRAGRVTYSSDRRAQQDKVADRPYFQIYQREPQTRFYIGPPVRGRFSGLWLVSATRPLINQTGEFSGLVMAAIELSYFDKLWRSVELGAGSSIALFRRDGVLMMRSPFDEASIGKSFPDLPAIKGALDSVPRGHFSRTSVIDGTQRVFAYQVLPVRTQLVVVVGQAYDFLLAPWRRAAQIAVSIWGLASVAVALLAWFLNKVWLERARSAAAAQQMAQRLALATEASSIGVWDWDLKADRWYATPTYFSMLGYGAGEGVGPRAQWLDHVHPDDRERVAANIQAALGGADVPYRHDVRVLHQDGSYRWMSVIGRVLARDEAGKPSRLLGVMMDITEARVAEEALRRSLKEKEALLKEVHHRVKNNLQVISSLLRLESGRTREGETRDVLREMQGRIRSMALLHEALYRTGRFDRVDLAEYLRQLTTQLFRAQNTRPSLVALKLDLLPVMIGIDHAIPCGLIVNELLTNSFKHAFPQGGAGEVQVFLGRGVGGDVLLRVGDNGPGLPSDFEARRGESLGLQLVSDLARQIGGRLEITAAPSTSILITFPAGDEDSGS
ncbi:MAG: histidine kinase dimerization/phosphoacceptor domain -containing protein [Vicinamibacteria bacterium]